MYTEADYIRDKKKVRFSIFLSCAGIACLIMAVRYFLAENSKGWIWFGLWVLLYCSGLLKIGSFMQKYDISLPWNKEKDKCQRTNSK